MIKRLCVIGVGLIGGSIARAARTNGLCETIVGFDHNIDNLRVAKDLGVIDEYAFNAKDAVVGADFVVIAIPVGSTDALFTELRDAWSMSAVYTDAGSTKVSVVDGIRESFGSVPKNFVPGHPIAGREKSGVEAALADLYDGKRVILTPLSSTDGKAVARVTEFWNGIGALVSLMEMEHHDQVLAATSHLPHVIAYALVDMLGRKDEKNEIFRFAAGGFKDFTRLASSDPRMWLDICMANRSEIHQLIEEFKLELTAVADMLESQDADNLYRMFQCAKDARQRFLDQFDG